MTTFACQGCGVPLVKTWRGPNPKWCSERCRKAQYDTVCADCGTRVSGTDPGKRHGREPRCVSCRARETAAERKVWTRDAIVAAVREWAARYGGAPSLRDWWPGGARAYNDEARALRFEEADGRWPFMTTVVREFGTWNAALAAAGFQPRAAHGGGGNELRRRSAREKAAA